MIMDFPPYVKRLVVIIAISLIVIFVSKSLLRKAAKNLSAEAQKKQQAKTIQSVTTSPEPLPAYDSTESQK